MIERILLSTKRVMSMLLVLLMLFALIPSLGIEASAATASETSMTMDIPAESGFLTLTVTPTFGDGSVGDPNVVLGANMQIS